MKRNLYIEFNNKSLLPLKINFLDPFKDALIKNLQANASDTSGAGIKRDKKINVVSWRMLVKDTPLSDKDINEQVNKTLNSFGFNTKDHKNITFIVEDYSPD